MSEKKNVLTPEQATEDRKCKRKLSMKYNKTERK